MKNKDGERHMLLTAYVKSRETKKTDFISSESYKSKEAFWKHLEQNGHIVIRISNRRDLAAQEYDFVTFAAMKKWDDFFIRRFQRESEFHQIIKQINQIEL